MRPVTPSSNCLASYRPRPCLRAVFQSLAGARFTAAAERANTYTVPTTSRRRAQPPPRRRVVVFSVDGELSPKISTAEKNLDGR